MNKWTTARPYITIELWPASLGRQTTTSTALAQNGQKSPGNTGHFQENNSQFP